jgi:hypothetical protein
MDISSTAVNLWDYKWDMNGHGTSMAALTDDHPGLMRHVATRVDGKDDQTKLIEFLVKCADGTVDACIIVKVKYFGYMQAEYIFEILVKIEKL